MINEIATPFGLAMTTCGVKIFNTFVIVYYSIGEEEEEGTNEA